MKQLLSTLCVAVLFGCLFIQSAAAEDAQCQGIRARYAEGKQGANAENAMAYCAAREGKTDLAFSHLSTALQKGYHRLKDAQTDPDFDSIRPDPRWAKVIEQIAQAEQRYLKAINAELYQIYQDDQADRNVDKIDWSVVTPRDDARYARVLQLADAQLLKHGDDYFHAAMVMQHGEKPDDYQRAHLWAKKAFELNSENQSARWLACAAEDRYLQSIGKPQIWGTQYKRPKKDGPWTQEPFDRQAKTDAERKEMGVPGLAESQLQLDAMNKPGNGV